jgi:hypothetical protein
VFWPVCLWDVQWVCGLSSGSFLEKKYNIIYNQAVRIRLRVKTIIVYVMPELLNGEINMDVRANKETVLSRAWQTIGLLFPSEVYRPTRQAVLVRSLADRPDNATRRFNQLSVNRRREISRYLGDIVNSNLFVMTQVKSVDADTGYGHLQLEYQKATWEGVGGVVIRFQEGVQAVPAYIVRGNPLVVEGGHKNPPAMGYRN